MAKKTKTIKKIFIIEDHPIVRLGLIQLIRRIRGLEVCGEADNAQDAMRGISTSRPDMVLMALILTAGSGGFDILKQIQETYPNLPILVVSMHDESLFADRVLRAGALGYIMKKEATDHLVDAIKTVLSGSIYLSPSETSRLLKSHYARRTDASAKKRLSERELEVFQMISHGISAKEIAEKLHLSIKTVETHRDHIRRKLHLSNAAELRRYATQSSLSDAPLPETPGKPLRILRIRDGKSSG